MKRIIVVAFILTLSLPRGGAPSEAGAGASQSCPADCDGGGGVAINELVRCVNVALGSAVLATCAACDAGGDGAVAINELIAAVAAALGGCPPAPTGTARGATPTPSSTVVFRPTDTPTGTPVATATPPPSATAVATPTSTDTASPPPITPSVSPPPTNTRTATRTRPPSRTPTASPTFSITEDSDVVRAAAEISVQNAETFTMIDLGCVSAGCRSAGQGGARMAAGHRSALRTGAAGGPRGAGQACPGGGTITETCSGGVQSVVFDDCIEPGAEGHTNRRDGQSVLTVSDAGFCDDMVIDPLAIVVLELRDYRHVEFDAQSREVARLEADWVDTFSPRGMGCQLASDTAPLVDGDQEVRGTIRLACGAGAVELPCRRGSTDVTLTTAGLQIRRDSGGFPCELGLRVKGALQVVDRDRTVGGQQCVSSFTQTFDERVNSDSGELERFLIAEAPAGDGTSTVRQEGRMSIDAFGPLELRTQRQEIGNGTPGPGPNQNPASVQFVDGSDCPIGGDGEIEVRRPPLIDMQQIVCPAGPAPRVLHLGESELGSVEAPTFRFQEGPGGVPQIVFDFLGGDPQGMQTVTGCVGISRVSTCQ